MVTEGGWFPEVWKALTGAPCTTIRHTSTTADALFSTLKTLFANNWAVGAGSP
jgi:hypothetical protein